MVCTRRVCVASSSVPRVLARSLHVGANVAAHNAPLRVAMLGAGRIGQQHAQTLAALPQTELVAVRLHDMAAVPNKPTPIAGSWCLA